MDYELYCLMRDKALNMPDDFELFSCEICKGKHTKFNCPKLHFIPIKQHIAYRYIYKVKKDKNYRKYSKRYECNNYGALKIYRSYFQQLHLKPLTPLNTRKTLNNTVKIDQLLIKRRQEV